LNPDPVLNLLSVFLLEIVLLFAAVLAAVLVSDEEFSSLLSPAALLGLVYVPFYYFIPEPTLSTSYQFVFSAVSLALANTGNLYLMDDIDRERLEKSVFLLLNFVLTLFIAVSAYTAVYLF
jgi:hypothetical protein